MNERALSPRAERKQQHRREMCESLDRQRRLLKTLETWETTYDVDLSLQRGELLDEGIRPLEAALADLDQAEAFWSKLEAGEICNN